MKKILYGDQLNMAANNDLQKEFDAITIQAYELRTQEKYDEALKLVQPFAEKGLAVAQHIVATFYYFGESVPIDLIKASEWLQKAAEHILGCVMCSPGCFSLFRGSALVDDHVLRTYQMKSSEARHYVH